MNEPLPASYEFGPFSVDAGKRLLLRHGEPVPLAPKVLETLRVLIENRERVLSKDELLKQIWGDTIVEEGGLTRNVSVLRKALGEKPEDHQYVVTVPARGYRFVAEVRVRRGNDESSSAHGSERLDQEEPQWRLSPGRWFVLGVAALGVASLAYLLWPVGATDLRGTPPSVNPEAYDSVLRARYLSVRTTDVDTQAAIALLERAVALDPTFAAAYGDLAAAYVTRLTFVTPEETGDLEQKAFAAAEKALLLDPNVAEAYLARGDLLWTHSHHFAHARAVQEFRREREDAWVHMGKAQRKYPNDPSGALSGIEAILLTESEPLEAQALIEKVAMRKAVNPSHHAAYFAASAWARMGRADEAVQSLREAAETGFPCYPLFARDPTLDPIRQHPHFQAFLADMEKQSESLRTALFDGK